MKKTYFSPNTLVQQIELQGMIARSPNSTMQFNGDGTGSGKLQNENAEGDAMSRGAGLWDDEE